MLTSRELATVLAALRLWQRQLAFVDGWPHFADAEPLSAAEIDTLCDRLNHDDARFDSEMD